MAMEIISHFKTVNLDQQTKATLKNSIKVRREVLLQQEVLQGQAEAIWLHKLEGFLEHKAVQKRAPVQLRLRAIIISTQIQIQLLPNPIIEK